MPGAPRRQEEPRGGRRWNEEDAAGSGRRAVWTDYERLGQLDDGRLIYRLKRRWRDGMAAFVFEPEELVARLAALVPPPRFHLVRYAGVLAPARRVAAALFESDTDWSRD